MFKFFKSLFLTPTSKPEWIENTPLSNQFVPVPKWTHPGKFGKDIYCPKCHQTEHVKNFGWKEMTCSGCGETAIKYKWLLKRR